jgi:hypothetical protein
MSSLDIHSEGKVQKSAQFCCKWDNLCRLTAKNCASLQRTTPFFPDPLKTEGIAAQVTIRGGVNSKSHLSKENRRKARLLRQNSIRKALKPKRTFKPMR